MNKIKSEYNRGDIECVELYNDTYKILEKTNGQLWNTNEKHTIVVAKSRLADYAETTVSVDLEELKKLDEAEQLEKVSQTLTTQIQPLSSKSTQS